MSVLLCFFPCLQPIFSERLWGAIVGQGGKGKNKILVLSEFSLRLHYNTVWSCERYRLLGEEKRGDCPFFSFLFKDLFIYDREREAETQEEGEAGSMQGA